MALLSDALGLLEKLGGPAPAEAIVSVEDVRISQFGEVDVESTDYVDGETFTEKSAATQAVITLTNRGAAAQAFSTIEARVLDAVILRDCFVAGGEIGVSANYEVPLPEPEPGAVAKVPIAWEVRGLSNDRFAATMGNPALTTLSQLPIYRVELSLLSGGGDELLSIDPIIVANEIPHYEAFFGADAPFSGCPEENREKLTSIMALEGQRSEGLAAFADAVKLGFDIASLHLQSCLPGTPWTIKDLQPIDVPPADQSSVMAAAIECADRNGNLTIVVAIPGDAGEVLEFAPSHPAFSMDMTVLSGALTLDYQTLGEGQLGFFRETVVFRGGNLASGGVQSR